jgi:hypothetical protein
MRVKLPIFILLCLILFKTVFAQKYTNNQFVIFSYSVDIDERVRQELSALERYINYSPAKNQNKLDATIIHTFYNTFTKTFVDSLNVFFLSPSSLTDKAKYNAYGYPEILIQKAIRLSDIKYFMKISVSIENSKYDDNGRRLTNDEFLPLVTVSIDIYNKFGYNPIQSAEGQALSTSRVVITPGFLAGMNFVSKDIETEKNIEPLIKLMENAILDVLQSVKYTKQR